MLKTGHEHLRGIRDGRRVFIGKELVTDVPGHPAFRNGAHTLASLFDLKRDPAYRETLTHEEDGDCYASYFLMPRSRQDLEKRTATHKVIADATHGLFGRSPDHVASFITGMVLQAEVLDAGGAPGRSYAANLRTYYDYARKQDLFVAYAVLPAPGARDPKFSGGRDKTSSLAVVREEDDGLVVSGMKLLATGAAFADEIWVGNVQPLAPERKREAVTFAVPIGTPGLTLWSRKPMEPTAESEFDNPLSHRFDETDAIVLFDDVKVPWERVFSHDDPVLSREIYYRTPSHCFGNHQSNVRFWSKLQLLVGLAAEIASTTQTDKIPAVRERLGRLAALEAMIAGMVHGQLMNLEDLGNGYVSFNRRYMYGALSWCTENYAQIADDIRELMGGGVFLMPANISVMHDPTMRQTFEENWSSSTQGALDRIKLMKLAWDMLGSEFASRHWQYERFYGGPPYVIRDHSFREAPWAEFRQRVTSIMASYGVPEADQ
jgi:4-hydroxyphenylacetate 3-monooxygenase